MNSTLLKKYETIDQSKVSEKDQKVLAQVKKLTNNFEETDEAKNKVAEKILDQITTLNPDSVKKPKAVAQKVAKVQKAVKAKKVTKAKAPATTSTAKGSSNNIMSVAKEIQKAGESWKDAMERAKVVLKERREQVVEQKKSELEKLLALVRTKKELQGFTKSDLRRDMVRTAKPRGARFVTKEGNTSNKYGTFPNKLGRKYWETRDRHADRLAPNYPKNMPLLASGGAIENIAVTYGKMLNDLSKEKQFNKKTEKNAMVNRYAKENDITIDNNNIIYIKGQKIAFIDKINQKTGQFKTNWDIKKFADGGMFEEPIPMMREVKGKTVSVPVTDEISQSEINRFVDYVYEAYESYEQDGVYEFTKPQVRKAVNKYLAQLEFEHTWGGGDSLDRERVYEFLINPNLKEIKNPRFLDGGMNNLTIQNVSFANGGILNFSDFDLENSESNSFAGNVLVKTEISDERYDDIIDYLDSAGLEPNPFMGEEGTHFGFRFNGSTEDLMEILENFSKYLKSHKIKAEIDELNESDESFAKGGKIMPFLKFEYAVEAREKLNNNELPVFDGGVGFNYLDKEKKLYYLPSVTGSWEEVGDFDSKEESIKWLSERLKMEGFANGGSVNMDKHVWEGWTVGDFIEELEPTFNQIMSGRSWQKPFKTKDEVKAWAMDNQPYYKKNIPEVVNYFWAKAQSKGNYADGGMTIYLTQARAELKSYSDEKIAKIYSKMKDLDYSDVIIELKGNREERQDAIEEILKEANKRGNPNTKLANGGGIDGGMNNLTMQNVSFEKGGIFYKEGSNKYGLGNTEIFVQEENDMYCVYDNVYNDESENWEIKKLADFDTMDEAKEFAIEHSKKEYANGGSLPFMTDPNFGNFQNTGAFELGGAFMTTDLAGHSGGGTGGLNADMPLSGVSGTYYTGLVGETGAMSSGELFAVGGAVGDNVLGLKKGDIYKVIDTQHTAGSNVYTFIDYVDKDNHIMLKSLPFPPNPKKKNDFEYIYEVSSDGIKVLNDEEIGQIISRKYKNFVENNYELGGAMAQNQQVINDASQSYVNYYLGEGASQGIYKDGGSIPNNYKGRTAEDVWNNYTERQRQHFLYDHNDQINKYGRNKNKLTTDKITKAISSDWSTLDSDIKGAFNIHVSQGQYAYGGKTKSRPSMRELYIEQIAYLTNTREVGVDAFAKEHNLTDSELSNLMSGLGRKMISQSDFITALVGNKNNPKQKEVVAFAKSDKAYKMADGGALKFKAGYGEKYFDKREKMQLTIGKETNIPNVYNVNWEDGENSIYSVDNINFLISKGIWKKLDKMSNGGFTPDVSDGTQFMSGVYANGGGIRSQEELNKIISEKDEKVKGLTPKQVAEMWNENSFGVKEGISKPITVEEAKSPIMKMYLRNLLIENELTEDEYNEYFESGGFVGTVEFNTGDVVWQKDEKRYATVMNNYGDPVNGDYGELRLDTTGNTPIFTYDKNYQSTGYNLVKLGEKGDTGKFTPEVVAEMKESANRLIDMRKERKDTEMIEYYEGIYKRLLDGEFDSMVGRAKATASSKLKKYIDNEDINYVALMIKGSRRIVKGSDVLNGANLLKDGGDLTNIAFYVPKRDVISVTLKNGKTIKPVNGYWVKKDYQPISGSGGNNVDESFKIGDYVKKTEKQGSIVYGTEGFIYEIDKDFSEIKLEDDYGNKNPKSYKLKGFRKLKSKSKNANVSSNAPTSIVKKDSNKLVAPKGYVFVNSGSHRATQQINRGDAKYVSLYSFGGANTSAGTTIMFMTEKDFEKVKDIRGVSPAKNSLPAKSQWFSRHEDKNLDKVFLDIEQRESFGYADGGQMEVNDIDAELEDFDLDNLDPFETMQYENYSKSMSKVDALQVLIDTVEGDYSQLSPELAELAEMQISQEEWDESSREMYGYANGGEVKDKDGFNLYDKLDNTIKKDFWVWEYEKPSDVIQGNSDRETEEGYTEKGIVDFQIARMQRGYIYGFHIQGVTGDDFNFVSKTWQDAWDKYDNDDYDDIDDEEDDNVSSFGIPFDDDSYAKGGEIADIQKMKKALITKAKSRGLYENFGQKEVRVLEDKYGYTNNVRDFDNWAMNFDLSQMAYGGGVAFKPYGKTKGKFKITYLDGGEKQSEIRETLEMAIDTANRYKKYDEFSKIEVFDESGKKIMADGGFMNDVYADGGELKGKFLAEIKVPYNYERVVKDEFEFTEFLSKKLTNNWFGNGYWGVTIVKPLFEKDYSQKIVVEIQIPVGVTQGGGLDKFDVEEFISKTLTKKWFGNGYWGVDIVSSYADGGMFEDNEGFMRADNNFNYRYPEMEVYVETFDEPIDLTSNVSSKSNKVVIKPLDENIDLSDDKRVRATMGYTPKNRNPESFAKINPRAFEFIEELPMPTSNTHKND